MFLSPRCSLAILVDDGGVAFVPSEDGPLHGEFVVGPTSPGKWGPSMFGTGATVTWSLMGSGIGLDTAPSAAPAGFLPGGFLAEITAAFAQWSTVADITFIQVADGGGAFNIDPIADIRIAGEALDGTNRVLAHGFYPPNNGLTAAGDIHLDTAETWKLGFGGAGFDLQQIMAHEIGHAIGLSHTTVPSSLMNPFYSEAFAGVQADDIAGAVFIYGAAIAVPEPSAFWFLGLAGIGAIGRAKIKTRRRQRALTGHA